MLGKRTFAKIQGQYLGNRRGNLDIFLDYRDQAILCKLEL